jgi:N-acetyl-anhydromuramyl-L-alanine amidase AmpD
MDAMGADGAEATRRTPPTKEHYHILIEGDGKLVRDDHSIADDAAPVRGGYTAHTLNCNTGSIGVSLCCMAGAKENPFDPGKFPMTREQWRRLAEVVADLYRRYEIPVTRATVLSHADSGNSGITRGSPSILIRWGRS